MQMIDVLKRLAELDAKNPARPESKLSQDQAIKTISESSQVSECGMMPEITGEISKPTTPASINMSAGSADELGDLIRTIASLTGASAVDQDQPLSEPATVATSSPDGADMRAMLDKLNPEPHDSEEDNDDEEQHVAEYDNAPNDPTDVSAYDSEEYAHHENPPGAADGRAQTSNPRAVTFESLMAEYTEFKKKDVSEDNGTSSVKSDVKKYTVQCSQCGNSFKRDKDVGYSHCRDHRQDSNREKYKYTISEKG